MITIQERNDIIDEVLAVIESLERPNCEDHTPFRGPCCTCNCNDNWTILPHPDVVKDEIELLKKD